MIDVTVILLEGGLPSTSMAPLEIFPSAGTLWGMLMREPTEQRFRVRTATVDGRDAELGAGLAGADVSLRTSTHRPRHGADRRHGPGFGARADPATSNGCRADVEEDNGGGSLFRRAPARRRPTPGRAPRDDSLGRRRSMPRHLPERPLERRTVRHRADNILCGGGLYASVDLSLYLVERYCGHRWR